jgi:hypothetical protein
VNSERALTGIALAVVLCGLTGCREKAHVGDGETPAQRALMQALLEAQKL